MFLFFLVKKILIAENRQGFFLHNILMQAICFVLKTNTSTMANLWVG